MIPPEPKDDEKITIESLQQIELHESRRVPGKLVLVFSGTRTHRFFATDLDILLPTVERLLERLKSLASPNGGTEH